MRWLQRPRGGGGSQLTAQSVIWEQANSIWNVSAISSNKAQLGEQSRLCSGKKLTFRIETRRKSYVGERVKSLCLLIFMVYQSRGRV